MENVVLIVHLLLALALIGVVLLQRSEGGGLGIGGGGGGINASRPPLTGLGKMTWGLAVAFICTSITLTVLAARGTEGISVVDRFGTSAPAPAPAEMPLPGLDLPLPPPPAGDAPMSPPRAD